MFFSPSMLCLCGFLSYFYQSNRRLFLPKQSVAQGLEVSWDGVEKGWSTSAFKRTVGSTREIRPARSLWRPGAPDKKNTYAKARHEPSVLAKARIVLVTQIEVAVHVSHQCNLPDVFPITFPSIFHPSSILILPMFIRN